MPTAKPTGPSARLNVEALEDRTVLSPFGMTRGMSLAAGQVFESLPNSGTNQFVTGTGPGTVALVRVFDDTGHLLQSFHPFGDFTGGVTVALGDVNADGVQDIICGTGAGTTARVKVFTYQSGSLQRLAAIIPFGPNFSGGVNVAAGVVAGADLGSTDPDDLNPDNIVVSVASNGLPAVKVFQYTDTGTFQIRGFMAYPTSYTGGVSLTVGNIDSEDDTTDPTTGDLLPGDQPSYAEIITGRAAGLPQVRIFDAQSPDIIMDASYMAFDITNPANQRGITLVAGDTTGTRGDDIYVNLIGSTTVRCFQGETSAILETFNGLPGSSSKQLSMAISDMTGNNPGPDENPVDDDFAGLNFQHDLLVVAADGPYVQVPTVWTGGALPAGLNGHRPA